MCTCVIARLRARLRQPDPACPTASAPSCCSKIIPESGVLDAIKKVVPMALKLVV